MIEFARFANEDLGEPSVDSPITTLVGSGDSATLNRASEAHMIELIRLSVQTRFNIAKTLPVG